MELNDLLDLWEELSAKGEVRSVEEFLHRAGGGLGEKEAVELRRRIELLIAANRRFSAMSPEDNSDGEFSSNIGSDLYIGKNANIHSTNGAIHFTASAADLGPLDEKLFPGAEIVPGYRLLERLGRGGFGEVWKTAGPGNFSAAMKFVPLSGRNVEIEKESLDVIREIHHPNLLPVFGVWETDGFLVIATALADETLYDRYKKAVSTENKGLDAKELLPYFKEIAKVLDYLNAPSAASDSGRRPIQHGDIKPQNILLSGGSALLGDFGLARALPLDEPSTHSGSLTLVYAAPECLDGHFSRQSDQYSLAATWCFLRTGKLPFGDSVTKVFSSGQRPEPDLSDFADAEAAAVKKGLAADPHERYSDCSAFCSALADAVARPPRAGRSLRWIFSGLFLALLLGLLRLFIPLSAEEKADRHYQLGLNELSKGNEIQAETELNKALEIYPRHADALQKRAELSLAANRIDSADNDVKVLAQLRPDSAQTLVLRGQIAFKREEYQTALDAAREAVAHDKNNAAAWNLSGETRFFLGDYKNAKNDFAEAKKLDPLIRSTLDRHGKVLAEMADWNAAAASLNELIAFDDTVPQYYLDRGYALLQLGRFDKSLADFNHALDMTPKNATAYLLRGAVNLGLERYDDAFADYDRALELEPETAEFWLKRGNAFGMIGEFDRSISDLNEAIRLNPESAPAYNLRAAALIETGRFDEATPDLDRALELIPEYPEAYYQRGIVARSKRNMEQALLDFTKAIRYDPTRGRFYRLRGLTCADLNKNAEAKADFDRAVELDPTDAHALAARANVQSNFDDAFNDISAAIKLLPNDIALYMARAVLFYDHGDYQLALADAANMARLDPDSPLVPLIRAEIYEKLNAPEKAAEELKKLEKLEK